MAPPIDDHENNLAKFKNADVIGHPGVEVFNQFVSSSGYFCEGAGTAFMPYCSAPWTRWPGATTCRRWPTRRHLIPGMREVGARTTRNLWGNVYPRGGFLHQTDDHKAGAVVAQRAGDVVTRRGQIHVYQPLLASSRPGYWPAGALMEGDASTGKWQELTPVMSSSCTVFPRSGFLTQAQQGDYAWALWRPYACCERRGQVFLGSVDFQ
jgi:integrating conjugative element protein (TIGR03756 family)